MKIFRSVALYEETPAAPEGTKSTGTYDPCSQIFYYELQQISFRNVAVLLTLILKIHNDLDGRLF